MGQRLKGQNHIKAMKTFLWTIQKPTQLNQIKITICYPNLISQSIWPHQKTGNESEKQAKHKQFKQITSYQMSCDAVWGGSRIYRPNTRWELKIILYFISRDRFMFWPIEIESHSKVLSHKAGKKNQFARLHDLSMWWISLVIVGRISSANCHLKRERI